jgi:hypothetical protein
VIIYCAHSPHDPHLHIVYSIEQPLFDGDYDIDAQAMCRAVIGSLKQHKMRLAKPTCLDCLKAFDVLKEQA